MNPEEYPLYRALSVRLAGPNAHRVLQLLAVDDRLRTRLLSDTQKAAGNRFLMI